MSETLEQNPTEPSLRDTIEQAIESPAPEAPAPSDAPLSADGAPETPPSTEEPKVSGDTRERDEYGRFKAKAPETGATPPSIKPPQSSPTPTAQAPTEPEKGLERAPASWKPAAREEWAKLSPAVRAEVARRESEIQTRLQETAQVREMVGELQGVLAPYAANVQASGMDAVGMMRNLFQADHELRHGTPQHKAQVIANIIRTYGVDLQTLDSTLAGQPVQADPQQATLDALRRELQQQLQPVQQFMSQAQLARQQAAQRLQTEAEREIEAVASEEFFENVRLDMADLLDAARTRGVAMTLKEAYDRAVRANPETWEVFQKRLASERVEKQNAIAQRARAAAVSPPSGAPAGHGAPATGGSANLRSAIVNAVETLSDQ